MTSTALIPYWGPEELVIMSARLPTTFLSDTKSTERFWESFAANIRNKSTPRAHYRAAGGFSDWCELRDLFDLSMIKPIRVAAFIEGLQVAYSKPTEKQHLAALRMLF
jgi:hypothetical protein